MGFDYGMFWSGFYSLVLVGFLWLGGVAVRVFPMVCVALVLGCGFGLQWDLVVDIVFRLGVFVKCEWLHSVLWLVLQGL